MPDTINALQNNVFNFIILITYSLYFLILFGLSTRAPEYLEVLQYWVKMYVSVFLIFRFNFLRKITFTDLDRKIAFSAGLFLLTTTFIDQKIRSYIEHARKYITSYPYQ